MNSITPGLTYTWTDDNQVLVYEASAISVYIMFEWSNHIIQMISNWPEGKPLQILYNLSRPKISIPYMVITNRDIFNIGITDVGKAKIQQILLNRKTLFGRLAVVVSRSGSGEVVRTHARSSTPAIESRLFTDYPLAIQWLSDKNSIARDFRKTTMLSDNPSVPDRKEPASDDASITHHHKKLGLVYDGRHTIAELYSEGSLVIGRQDFPMSIVEGDTYSISRLHAQFDRVASQLFLTDLNSTNGTFINGRRLIPGFREAVQVGDEICFGSVIVQLAFAKE